MEAEVPSKRPTMISLRGLHGQEAHARTDDRLHFLLVNVVYINFFQLHI